MAEDDRSAKPKDPPKDHAKEDEVAEFRQRLSNQAHDGFAAARGQGWGDIHDTNNGIPHQKNVGGTEKDAVGGAEKKEGGSSPPKPNELAGQHAPVDSMMHGFEIVDSAAAALHSAENMASSAYTAVATKTHNIVDIGKTLAVGTGAAAVDAVTGAGHLIGAGAQWARAHPGEAAAVAGIAVVGTVAVVVTDGLAAPFVAPALQAAGGLSIGAGLGLAGTQALEAGIEVSKHGDIGTLYNQEQHTEAENQEARERLKKDTGPTLFTGATIAVTATVGASLRYAFKAPAPPALEVPVGEEQAVAASASVESAAAAPQPAAILGPAAPEPAAILGPAAPGSTAPPLPELAPAKHAAAVVAAPIEPVGSAGTPGVPDKVVATAAPAPPAPSDYQSLKDLAARGATEQDNFDFGDNLAALKQPGQREPLLGDWTNPGGAPEGIMKKGLRVIYADDPEKLAQVQAAVDSHIKAGGQDGYKDALRYLRSLGDENLQAGLDSRGFPREIPPSSSVSGADSEALALKARQEQFENPAEFTKALGGNVEAAFLRRPIDPTGPSSDLTSVFRDPSGDVHGVVADWMGHGQASALESVRTHEAFSAQGLASRLAGRDANEGLREIDEIAQDIMSNGDSSEKTLSASHISLNPDTGRLNHAGAGGDLATYIARADGTVTELPAESPAITTQWKYGELGSSNNEVQLNKGDFAFTHSDGLESVIPRERLPGFLGLAARSGASPEKMISRIQRLFRVPDDDISIAILRWNGPS